MRCPICGAKLYQKQICPYCKVTNDQITLASNRKVKEYRKTDRSDLVHYTTIIPSDISKVKLYLYTILLGWIGVNHLYIYRPVRGIYSCVSTGGSIIALLLYMFVRASTTFGKYAIQLMYEVFFLMMAINVIMWGFDIIAVICRTFKIPVVLAKKGEKNG